MAHDFIILLRSKFLCFLRYFRNLKIARKNRFKNASALSRKNKGDFSLNS
jgi:hypothetical protein